MYFTSNKSDNDIIGASFSDIVDGLCILPWQPFFSGHQVERAREQRGLFPILSGSKTGSSLHQLLLSSHNRIHSRLSNLISYPYLPKGPLPPSTNEMSFIEDVMQVCCNSHNNAPTK